MQSKLSKLNQFEGKLRRYNGYRYNTIVRWMQQMYLSSATKQKILTELRVITSREIREMLCKVVAEQKNLFDSNDCYICKFGEPGKSGEIILYEFRHSCRKYANKIIETWNVPELPDNSTIIFIDDLVGTGRQSTEYINDTISYFLNPSHKALLLSLCGTPQGLDYVKSNTNFHTICHLVLDEQGYQHYSSKSRIFNSAERILIKEINNMLQESSGTAFDKGLLIAFYYSVPNNTMSFIWKDNYSYIDKNGKSKHWFALLPRLF